LPDKAPGEEPAASPAHVTDPLERLGLTSTGPLAAKHVPMHEGEAVSVVRRWWGVCGRATRLPAEKDDTFRIDSQDGRTFVAKIAGPTERADELDFETKLMQHVTQSRCGVAVPRVLPARNGEMVVSLRDRSGQRRLARLITLIPGTPLDATHTSAIERERIGEALARLRQGTAGFRHPADGRWCAWDVAHLPVLYPLLGAVEDIDHRTRLETGLAQFDEVVTPRLRHLRTQVVHNDFSKSNILVDHDLACFVTGIVDFGDAVRTATAIDVSTALLNQLPRTPRERVGDDLFAQGRDLLRGYLRRADLTDMELSLLPHFVRGRVIARALITLYRAALIPANAPYILRNTEQGWAQLRWFAARSPDEVSQTFLG
jgi:Ser/Thr protein kinase RdoA (MazF antagonist)